MRVPILASVLSAATLMTTWAAAESIELDIDALPSRTMHETAQATPLAVTDEGAPAVLLLRVPAGREVPPHAAGSGLRLLTVIEGPLSWGNGDTIDRAAETLHLPGSVLMVPAGSPHWLAARDGDVLLQMVLLNAASPVPAAAEQMP